MLSPDLIFPHQKEVFETILSIGRVFFRGRWRKLPIVPRFNLFISGPTGIGKTHLVRLAAQRLGVPFLEVKATNWIPFGSYARSSRVSWPMIAEFCRGHQKGIIFLDEADKLFGQSDWSTHIRIEIFSLLDRTLPTGAEIPESDDPDDEATLIASRKLIATRLASSMLIIGAGAFQDLWKERSTRSVGFHSHSPSERPSLSLREASTIIPQELANRFIDPILSLLPLKRKDYFALLEYTASVLPAPTGEKLLRLGEVDVENAVSNQVGCRWIEALLLRLLLKNEFYQGLPCSETSPKLT